jgi:hypothetical protein
MFNQNRGRGGVQYDYFCCLGRHTRRNGCDLPYVPREAVEAAIERFYDTLTFGPDTQRLVGENVMAFAHKESAPLERRARRERQRIS